MAYKNFTLTEIIEEIGLELKKIRLQKKLTISHVANELANSGLHISSTLLSRMENGERRIDDVTLKALCQYYNVNPHSVVITASQVHIEKLHDDDTNDLHDVTTDSMKDQLTALYNNINADGQNEILHLMRMMAYMEAFKK